MIVKALRDVLVHVPVLQRPALLLSKRVLLSQPQLALPLPGQSFALLPFLWKLEVRRLA